MKTKTKFSLLILLFLFTILYSCKKENTKPASTSSTETTDSITNTDLLMLQLVNAARTKGCTCGATMMPPVNPLAWNSILAQVALDHSKDMNVNNYFSHTGLDGSSPGDRITKAGYIWSSYGENIAFNYPDEQAVMDAWLQSEGHCKNIMDADFKEMGTGKDGGYWTQDFGSKQ